MFYWLKSVSTETWTQIYTLNFLLGPQIKYQKLIYFKGLQRIKTLIFLQKSAKVSLVNSDNYNRRSSFTLEGWKKVFTPKG